MRIKTTLTCLAAAVSILGAGSAQAEESAGVTMETITVTANKVEEDITDVPQSITVITDEILKEKGIEEIPDIINEIPNMAFEPGFNPNVNFRGLNTSYHSSNNPVVIYVDGVAYSNQYGFDASLVNVERVEVLRGPQGTLYGKDAIGAVIKVVTKEPENEWHGNIGTEYASYNDIQGSFNVNGPLSQDKLYLGLYGRYQQDDGWITNDYTGDDKANRSYSYNFGGSLLYKPTDRFLAKVNLSNDFYNKNWPSAYALNGTDVSDFSRDNAEHVSYDIDSWDDTESMIQSLQLKYKFDSMTLESTTTHRDVDSDIIRDKDKMANTAKDGLVTFGFTETDTWVQELRLSSNNTEGVRWIGGVYLESEEVDKGPYGIQFYRSGTAYEMNYESVSENETMAMFGQTMIPLGERFELTLGGRYQYIDKKMDQDIYYNPVGVSSDPYYSLQFDETWDAFLGKVALSYRLDDKWNTYVTIAQGYMPGGFNYSASSSSAEDNTFGPQKSISYEAGIKGGWDRARLAAALFYMDIQDIHFYKMVNDMTVTENADGAHSLGVELELTYFLTDSIELTAALGIIDAEYDDYDTGTVVYDGESISNTPLHSARIGAAYLHPSGFYARGDMTNQGKMPYYDSNNKDFRELDGYTFVNVKAGYRFKGYDIYAYCNNLTDEEYMISYNSGLANSGDPRTFGIGIRYSF